MTDAGIIEERLKQRLREEFHDALRQGRITAWGTPSSGGPEKEINAEEWSNLEIAFSDEELTSIPYPIGGVNQLAAWQRKTDPRYPVFTQIYNLRSETFWLNFRSAFPPAELISFPF